MQQISNIGELCNALTFDVRPFQSITNQKLIIFKTSKCIPSNYASLCNRRKSYNQEKFHKKQASAQMQSF